MTTPRHIDSPFLLKKFPEIARMVKLGATWDEIGLAMLRGFQRFGSRQQSAVRPRRGSPATPEAQWAAAKSILRRLFHDDVSTDFDDIRKRLSDSSIATTPLLLATVSLWLAGYLRKPVTMTTPVVATLLLGMARDGEAVWEDDTATFGA